MLKWLCGFFALTILGLICYLAMGKPITLTFSEQDVRTQISQNLPVEIEKNGVKANMTRLDVDFLESNQVHVDISMDLEGYGLDAQAEASTTSALRYSDGNFYLEQFNLDNLEVIPTTDTQDALEDIKTTAGELWNHIKQEQTSQDPETGLALEQLKDRTSDKFTAIASTLANNMLQTTPIYSLNGQGLKMDIAATALENVRLHQDKIEVDIDPRNIIYRALRLCAILLLSALIAIGVVFGLRDGA